MEYKRSEEAEIDLLQLIKALWRKAWIIALVTVICGGIFFGYAVVSASRQKADEAPVQAEELDGEMPYAAQTLMYVKYVGSSDILAGDTRIDVKEEEISTARSLVKTCAAILNARTTLEEVIALTGVDYTYEELAKMVFCEEVKDTPVFSVTVVSGDQAEAEKIAKAIGKILPEKVTSLVAGSAVMVVDDAAGIAAEDIAEVVEGENASKSAYVKKTVIGLLLGFVLACGVIVLKEIINPQIHDGEYLARTYTLPVLATIPELVPKKKESGEQTRAELGENLSTVAGEAFRLLRTNLELGFENCKVVGVTGSMAGEEATATAINLAYTMARKGSRVLLVEADLRIPAIARQLKLKGMGLAELLSGSCSLEETLSRPEGMENLEVMPAGAIPANPSELLASEKLQTMLEGMKHTYDAIVLDLPPVNAVSDAAQVSRLVDGMVMVVRQEHCDVRSLEKALGQLHFVGANILGFAVTGAAVRKKRTYGDYCQENSARADG